MKPICVKCHRFFRPKKTGVWFTEGMPKPGFAIDGETPTGLRQPNAWQPYKIWHGDLWACPDCGAEIIVGVARQPMSEHYLDEFERLHKSTGADKFQVNDC